MKSKHLFEWYAADMSDDELACLYWEIRLYMTQYSRFKEFLDAVRIEAAARGRDMIRIIRDFDITKTKSLTYRAPSPDAIRATRERLKLSQAEAASIIDVTERTWYRYESGDRCMTANKHLDFELLTNATIEEEPDAR